MKKMMKNFRAPGAEFRGAPFWAWNAKLDPKELVRQIRIFKQMGLGGFFMHSRVGLDTEYLGREWFDCVKACVAEAKRLGMQANLYDEDRWPSGAAGSLVTREDRYKFRFCAVEFFRSAAAARKAEAQGSTLAWFSAVVSGDFEAGTLKVTSARPLSSPGKFKAGQGRTLLRFSVQLMKKSSWFNGETYLDVLNPEAVRKFVEVTYGAYAREIGGEFGKTVPMIFTDEPNFWTWGEHLLVLPWTSRLPEEFRARYGYDLLPLLPELFFASVRRYSRVRMHYFDLLTSLFCEAFSGTIGKWCGEHGIRLTGHLLMEDQLLQSLFVGAAMRFYEPMQSPGIDLLTERWRAFNTAKQCSSMAHQFRRRWRVSETYGCTGWDFPFTGHKALGDWQYALGINVRCQHLSWYSAEAEAKRDYPASISYQSAWFDRYHVVEDYFARLGAAMSEGEEVCELLVIHPIESAWMETVPVSFGSLTKILKGMERRFRKVTDHLLEQKLDFDFGDEEILSRYGRVEDKKFKVNHAAYSAVLVPRLRTIRSTTLELLRKFASQGGTVVYLDAPPAYLDGVKSSRPAEVFARFRCASLSGAVPLLEKAARRVSVTGPSGKQIGPVLARLSRSGRDHVLFLCNYGARFKTETMLDDCMVRDRRLKFPEAEVAVSVPRSGRVYELDPMDGTAAPVKFVYSRGQYRFRTSFEELGSRLFLISEEEPGLPVSAKKAVPDGAGRKLPARGWKYELSEPNVLVLDHADWRADGREMGRDVYILKLDDELRKYLGKPPRGGKMVQPWLRGQQAPEKTVRLELTYHLRIGALPADDCRLAVEHPEYYSFELNGKKLKAELDGWWCDRCLQCVKIPVRRLKTGDNILILRSKYHENLPGLESMFLLGSFAVDGETVVRLPDTLDIGDWCGQGLRHYAADVTYFRDVEVPEGGAVLELGEWRGVLASVRVDGGPETLLPWQPYRAELPAGKHRIGIRICGSRRNAMGPFYCNETWPVRTGPGQFKQLDSKDRRLVPCGLLTPPVLRKIKR
ncbi:MAG: hypothetical protein IJS14_14700 [Lentisphaeria bacterium]|nr:hypothetical protein [Lentisphaeria bacterium]